MWGTHPYAVPLGYLIINIILRNRPQQYLLALINFPIN